MYEVPYYAWSNQRTGFLVYDEYIHFFDSTAAAAR
jgi:hypothetical protein